MRGYDNLISLFALRANTITFDMVERDCMPVRSNLPDVVARAFGSHPNAQSSARSIVYSTAVGRLPTVEHAT